jgi:RNA polymerase sigma-70 factor (ECF subfamily)
MFYAVCCDPERAWDAVQHAFLKLQEQNGTPIHDARAWLLQVGKNWLRDVARRRENAWRAPQSEQWDHVADRELDPAGAASRAELQIRVRQLMGEMKTEDREVLLMRYALGWSSARIAETVGGTVQAVDMRLSRARQRLGQLLTAAGINAESLD